jgi:phage major head subunit gpT-like protein
VNITPAVIDAIFYSFSTQFQGAYARIDPWWTKVASDVPSAGRENRYAWLRLLPRMREWIGERKYANLEAAGYALANKDYELSVEVDRNDIQDDNIGVYAPFVQMMGEQAKRWPDDLVLSLLQNGSTNLAFDGQAFFSASHPTGQPGSASTYSNYSASAMALSAANYQTVRQTMMSYVGEDGRPLQVQPSLLVVPPQLEAAARQILNADFIAPAAAVGQNAASVQQTNVLKGSAELLVVPDLTAAATTWYLLDTTKPIKPFVFQTRKAPTFVPMADPTSENVFKRRKFIFGVDARGNAGYALPFLAYSATA